MNTIDQYTLPSVVLAFFISGFFCFCLLMAAKMLELIP